MAIAPARTRAHSWALVACVAGIVANGSVACDVADDESFGPVASASGSDGGAQHPVGQPTPGTTDAGHADGNGIVTSQDAGSPAADAALGANDSGTPDAATTSPPPGVSPCDPQIAFLCDDFEQDSVGASPASPWVQSNEVKITTARAWSGTKAIEVPEGSATLRLNLNPPRDVLFVRLLIWTSFVGAESFSRFGITRLTSSDDHGATTDSASGLVSFHYWPGGEDAIDSTMALPTNQWACLEMSYDRNSRIFRAWLNGNEATELDAPLGGPAIGSAWTSFELRNEIIHGGTGQVFYDDVALGTARIGCPTM